MSTTTVKVTKSTLKELEALKKNAGAKTLEEVIRILILERKRRLLDEAFGKDSGKITKFTEADRGEDRR